MNEWMNHWISDWMNESLIEWMNEWMNEWISQSINQWLKSCRQIWAINTGWEHGSHPVSECVSEWVTSQSVSQAVSQAAQSVSQSAQSVSQSVSLLSQSVSQPVCSVSQSVSQSAQSVSQSVSLLSQSVSLLSQSINQSMIQSCRQIQDINTEWEHGSHRAVASSTSAADGTRQNVGRTQSPASEYQRPLPQPPNADRDVLVVDVWVSWLGHRGTDAGECWPDECCRKNGKLMILYRDHHRNKTYKPQ